MTPDNGQCCVMCECLHPKITIPFYVLWLFWIFLNITRIKYEYFCRVKNYIIILFVKCVKPVVSDFGYVILYQELV